MDQKSKGIYSRGKYIDLSEDEDGCWINTPYMISPKSNSLHCNSSCIARCKTLNDVLAAASVGLLFETYTEAEDYVQILRTKNEELNALAKSDDDAIYCPVCGHCGEVGCCGIASFLNGHVRNRTNCIYEEEILGEIFSIYNEYFDLLAEKEKNAKKKNN